MSVRYALAVAAALALPCAALAQTSYTWTGGSESKSWQEPTNWSPRGVPGADDEASFTPGDGDFPFDLGAITLDADVEVGSIRFEDGDESEVAFTSAGARFVRIGSVASDGWRAVFDLRVGEVGSVLSRGDVRLPDVGRVGSFTALTSRFTSASTTNLIGGAEEVGRVEVDGADSYLRVVGDGTRIDRVDLEGSGGAAGSVLTLGGSSIEIGSIGYGDGDGALVGTPGLRLRVRGFLLCSVAPPRYGCGLDRVDLTLDGRLRFVNFGPGSITALRLGTLRGSGTIEGVGAVEADVVDFSGAVDIGNEDDPFPSTVVVRDRAEFSGPVDLESVRVLGDPDSEVEPVAFDSATFSDVTFSGVRVAARGAVTLSGLGELARLDSTVFGVGAAGRLTIGGPVGVVVGAGGSIESAGTLEVEEFNRVDVPVTTTGVLQTALYDADTAPPSEAGGSDDRFSEAPFFAELAAGGTLTAGLGDRPAPVEGDAFVLFFYDALTGSFDAFDLPALPTGLRWAVTFEGGVALATVAPSTEPAACTTSSPLSFDADGDGAVTVGDFSTTASGSFMGATGEFAGVRNGGDEVDIDLSTCSFVTFDPFTVPESIIYSTTAGTVEAGDVFVLASDGGGQSLPDDVLFDDDGAGGPGAFALVEGPAQAGAPVSSVFGRIVAAVVYDRNGDVFGSVGGGATEAEMDAFRQALLDAFGGQAVSTDEAGGVDLTVAAWPNPTRGASTVGFGLAEGGAAEVAVYDVLGREVAVVADGVFGPGRHEVALPTLAAGAYVVRVASGAGVQTVRLTVAR